MTVVRQAVERSDKMEYSFAPVLCHLRALTLLTLTLFGAFWGPYCNPYYALYIADL